MAHLYVHPAITSKPLLIEAIEEETGLTAIADGHRARLVAPLTGRAARRRSSIEQRAGRLFVVGPCTQPGRGDLPGRPQ